MAFLYKSLNNASPFDLGWYGAVRALEFCRIPFPAHAELSIGLTNKLRSAIKNNLYNLENSIFNDELPPALILLQNLAN